MIQYLKGGPLRVTTKVSLHRDKKTKKWVVRWFGEFDPGTGKQKRPQKSFDLKRDAEAFQAEKQAEFNAGGRRDQPQKMSLGQLCAEHQEVNRANRRASTRETYTNTIARLIEHFGADRDVASITPREAERFLAAQKRRTKHESDKPLSGWSRDQIRRTARAIFRTAMAWGAATENPFAAIRGEKLTLGRWHRVRPHEYRALLDVAPDLRWKAFYALAYTTGLRSGELSNLTWNDIDFERRCVVVAARDATDDMPPFAVKDHESRRVPLTRHAIDILTAWQAEAPEAVPYVFLTADRYERVRRRWQEMAKAGKADGWKPRFMLNDLNATFKKHVKRAGIKPTPELTFHTLRKSCCQNWADHLPMNVTKEFMGHADIMTTAKYYSQVDAEHEERAAAIDDLLEGPAPGCPGRRRAKQTDAKLTSEADYAADEVVADNREVG